MLKDKRPKPNNYWNSKIRKLFGYLPKDRVICSCNICKDEKYSRAKNKLNLNEQN